MDDCKEQGYREEHKVCIEDLGAPEKGIGLFFFSLERKVRAATRCRVRSIVFGLSISLLALLLPGSALLSPAVHASFSVSQTRRTCLLLVGRPTFAKTPWAYDTVLHSRPGTWTVYTCNILSAPTSSKKPQP